METLKALERYDGAVLRFYTKNKDIVATCIFGIPAFRQGDDVDTFLSEPLSPDMKTPGGVMAFAMIGLRNSHTPVGPITVGLPDSDAVFKFDNLTIERGSMLCVGEIQMHNDQNQLCRIRAALEEIIKPEVKGIVGTTRKKKRLTNQGLVMHPADNSPAFQVKKALLDAGVEGYTVEEIALRMGEELEDVLDVINALYHNRDIENA